MVKLHYLLILLFACIVLFVVNIYIRKKPLEKFGNFYNIQKNFADSQYTRFQDSTGKEILTNSGVNMSQLDSALQQPDIYLPKSPDRTYASFFVEDPSNQYSEQDKSMCKNATAPRYLPVRKQGVRAGCGWYYVPDPSLNSVGALGTFNGPIFPDTLPNKGQWVWNIDQAQQLEDIKYCKKYKTCSALNIPAVKQQCSFCSLKGHAIPVNPDGSQKYPNDEDGSCGGELLRNPSDCTKPVQPPTTTASNGTSCGSLGRPSADNSWRMYTRAECDSLNGNFQSSGECLSKTGGSYSWECRKLNSPPSKKPTPTSICSIQNGKYSNACVVSLASGIGFSEKGGFIQYFKGSKTALANFNTIKSNALFNKALGYNIETIAMNQNYISPDTGAILQKLNTLYNLMSSSSAIVSGYAKWFVNGSALPDPCDLAPSDQGPFQVQCLQQQFRKAGCQASGSAYPASSSSFVGKTWADIANIFSDLYARMSSTDSTVQDKAVKDCLGIQYHRAPIVDDKFDFKKNIDRGGADIACYGDGRSPDFCREQCIKDARCKSYNIVRPGAWGASSPGGCCYKTESTPLNKNNMTDLWIKKQDNYVFIQGMDSGGNDIGNGPANDIAQLKSLCDANPLCKGFNTNGWLKGKISPPGYQYKWTNSPTQGLYEKKPKHLGCFNDCKAGRAIPNPRSWNMKSGDNLKECANLAKTYGDNVFGLQFYKECWTGKDPAYDRMGAAQNCPPNGGGCTQQVYKL